MSCDVLSGRGLWAVVTNYGVRGAPGNSLTVIDLESVAVARTIDVARIDDGIAFSQLTG